MNSLKYETRYASNPDAVKQYDTEQLRKEFLIETLFEADSCKLVYSHYDRFITGGVLPVKQKVELNM